MSIVTREYLIGIDEAGLGPVFGPLVVSGVIIESKNLTELEKIGVKDSKLFGSSQVSRRKRKEIWERTIPFIKQYLYKIISAEELDKNNMYDLEIQAIAEVLVELDWKIPKTIYIAQLGQTSWERISQKLQRYKEDFSSRDFLQKVVYEKDADSKYIPVALASIIAKTIRDIQVLQLCQKINEHYISGYPNNRTKDFLRRYFEKHNKLPPGVRRTRNWLPLQELIQKERSNL